MTRVESCVTCQLPPLNQAFSNTILVREAYGCHVVHPTLHNGRETSSSIAVDVFVVTVTRQVVTLF